LKNIYILSEKFLTKIENKKITTKVKVMVSSKNFIYC